MPWGQALLCFCAPRSVFWSCFSSPSSAVTTAIGLSKKEFSVLIGPDRRRRYQQEPSEPSPGCLDGPCQVPRDPTMKTAPCPSPLTTPTLRLTISRSGGRTLMPAPRHVHDCRQASLGFGFWNLQQKYFQYTYWNSGEILKEKIHKIIYKINQKIEHTVYHQVHVRVRV